MSTGVLTWPNMRTALNLNTGFFETSNYTLDTQMRIIAGNWDNAGQSVGNLQYNWGPADRLTELWNHMLNNHDSVVQAVFGADTTRYNEFRTVNLTYTRTNKIAWGETITDYGTPAGHALIEPWKTILGDLAVTPECVAKYMSMMDAYYIPNALDLFKQLNCTSRAALASLFDINVNRGRYYPCITLVSDFEQIDANGSLTDEQKEAAKVEAINDRGNDVTNAMDASAATFVPRRDCMANQGGTYFGAVYEPETQFDINQEPAIVEKLGSISVKLGDANIQNILLGSNAIQALYLGTTLLSSGEPEPYYTSKVPNTQFRTNSNSYAGFEDGAVTLESGQKLWIDVQNFVACKSYYTTDGSTPTEASPRYSDGLTFSQSCTLKVLNVSLSGIAEAIRTLTITISAKTWRYVRFVGHGDQTGVTTRLVELRAIEGATNRLAGLTPLAGYAAPNAGAIGVATDGAKVHAAGYPLWWSGEGIPDLKYDMGALYPINSINVCGYSPVGDPRTTQFKIYVSTDNTNWTLVQDYSANATNQPEDGFYFNVPQA